MTFFVVQEVDDAPQGSDDGIHFLSHHALPAASCARVSMTWRKKTIVRHSVIVSHNDNGNDCEEEEEEEEKEEEEE